MRFDEMETTALKVNLDIFHSYSSDKIYPIKQKSVNTGHKTKVSCTKELLRMAWYILKGFITFSNSMSENLPESISIYWISTWK